MNFCVAILKLKMGGAMQHLQGVMLYHCHFLANFICSWAKWSTEWDHERLTVLVSSWPPVGIYPACTEEIQYSLSTSDIFDKYNYIILLVWWCLPRQSNKIHRNILFPKVFLLHVYCLLLNNTSYAGYCTTSYLVNLSSDRPLLCDTGHTNLTSQSLNFLFCKTIMM